MVLSPGKQRLILLQTVGALSVLPYPFVLLATVMSVAAPGHNSANALPWVLLCIYPLVWIVLYVFSWRAMARGAVRLAFGISSIPLFDCLLLFGIFVFSWIGFGLGMMGVGPGGLHSVTIRPQPIRNALMDSILLASQNAQLAPAQAALISRAFHDIDAHPELVNVSDPVYRSRLNVAVGDLSIKVDGTISGDVQRQSDQLRLVRALAARGGHFNSEEAADLHKTWKLRRALWDGPVTTAVENPLVWRIVTHGGDPRPFRALTDKWPPVGNGSLPFDLKEEDLALLNRPTRLHGTPLYASLLDNAFDVSVVLIKAGGRLSAGEEQDISSSRALHDLFRSLSQPAYLVREKSVNGMSWPPPNHRPDVFVRPDFRRLPLLNM